MASFLFGKGMMECRRSRFLKELEILGTRWSDSPLCVDLLSWVARFDFLIQIHFVLLLPWLKFTLTR